MTIAREQPKLSYCSACSTELTWGAWKNSGKRMPAETDARGNLVLIDGFWVYAQPDNPAFDELEKYTSHFARCPKAKEFRRERER